jgi:hypothetical protein
MIEFPQRDCPEQIAVCPGTGNLIVAATNVMVMKGLIELVSRVSSCLYKILNFLVTKGPETKQNVKYKCKLHVILAIRSLCEKKKILNRRFRANFD